MWSAIFRSRASEGRDAREVPVRHVLAPVLQVVVAGLGLFVLYWFMLRQVGAHALGTWSVSVSLAGVSRLASSAACCQTAT